MLVATVVAALLLGGDALLKWYVRAHLTECNVEPLANCQSLDSLTVGLQIVGGSALGSIASTTATSSGRLYASPAPLPTIAFATNCSQASPSAACLNGPCVVR